MTHATPSTPVGPLTGLRRLALLAALLALPLSPADAHAPPSVGGSTLAALPAASQAANTAANTVANTTGLTPELAAVRQALAKYEDPYAAVRDGYFSTVGCVVYSNGGMGVHFINPALIAPAPDPLKPQILVYEPEADGTLRLVAAEWFIPLATGVTERPSLFGRPFDGPMEGHEPLMPRELHHYDLHVWLFKENPAGLFNAINPTVDCAASPFRLPEEPPAIVAHR